MKDDIFIERINCGFYEIPRFSELCYERVKALDVQGVYRNDLYGYMQNYEKNGMRCTIRRADVNVGDRIIAFMSKVYKKPAIKSEIRS